ncbi:MAG: hypothetical protein ACREDR_32025, partial [Blastocatellia bacterium]
TRACAAIGNPLITFDPVDVGESFAAIGCVRESFCATGSARRGCVGSPTFRHTASDPRLTCGNRL